MARKTKTITIPIPAAGEQSNRDAGKTFVITEMPAFQAEKWAQRAFLAVMSSGIDIPDYVSRMGVAGVLAGGLSSLMTVSFVEAEPLLDEMMTCVAFMPDRKEPTILRPIDPEDIEEVSTLLTLRSEVIEVHTGFSLAAILSPLKNMAASIDPNTNPTETSPNSSET